jgi:hypothetical protein
VRRRRRRFSVRFLSSARDEVAIQAWFEDVYEGAA